MKKCILFCLALLFGFTVDATLLTVSNDPGQPAQYIRVADALAAAQNGDTLYVFGSTISYGNAVISKPVTIIGSGVNTARTAHARTTFDKISISNNTGNVTLSGVYSTWFTFESAAAGSVIADLKIEYSYIANFNGTTPCGVSYNNFLINNCILGDFALITMGCIATSQMSNVMVKNCQIGRASGGKNIAYYNCLFGGTPYNIGGNGGDLWVQQNCTFYNCMFRDVSMPLSVADSDPGNWQFIANRNNTFYNSLTYLKRPNPNSDLNAPAEGNTATGTIVNTDPLFLESFVDAPQQARIRWRPQLSPSSPAYKAGTDGTDIGVTGGAAPYRYSLEPNLPIVRKMMLQNAVIPSNGVLTIQVSASKAQ